MIALPDGSFNSSNAANVLILTKQSLSECPTGLDTDQA